MTIFPNKIQFKKYKYLDQILYFLKIFFNGAQIFNLSNDTFPVFIYFVEMAPNVEFSLEDLRKIGFAHKCFVQKRPWKSLKSPIILFQTFWF